VRVLDRNHKDLSQVIGEATSLTYRLAKKKRIIKSKSTFEQEATANCLHFTSHISDSLRAIIKEYQHSKLKQVCLTIFVKGLFPGIKIKIIS